MRDHLRKAPQEILSTGPGKRRGAPIRRRQIDLQLDIIDRVLPLLLQVIQDRGLVLQLGRAERLQRIGQHDPRRDGGPEVLGVEGAQRHVLPRLDVARRPVVHEHEPEDVRRRLADRDRLAHAVPRAQEAAELELDVETPAGAQHGHFRLCARVGQDLAVGSPDWCP